MRAIWMAREAGAPPASTVCTNGKEHCPVYDACRHGTGYYAQVARAAAADVVILAHNYLFEHPPEPITKRVSLVVIDEDPTGHGEETIEMPLSVLDFAEHDSPVRSNGKADDAKTIELEQLYKRIRPVLEAGNPTPKALAAEGLTRADMRKTRQLSWKRKIAHGMSPSMSLEDRRAAAKKAAINIRLRAIAKLTEALEEIAPTDDGSPQLGLHDSAGRVQVEGGVITVYGQREIQSWVKDLPTVILAARISPDRVRRFFPNLEAPAMPRPAAPHQVIHQHLGGFGTHHLPEKVPDLILEFRRIIAERSALIIAPKSVIPALRAGLPTASFLHHGALTGTDQYGKVDVVIVLGSVFPDPRDIASRASADAGMVLLPGPIELIPATALLADGSGVGFLQPGFRDPLLQAALEQVRNSALEQAIGRARGINRTTADPVEVHTYSSAVLPHPVTSITRWRRPSRIHKMVATGLVLTNDTDMATVHPDLFPTPKAASHARERWGGTAGMEALIRPLAAAERQPWVRVTYQRQGQGHKAASGFVGKDRLGELRQMLGPLSLWRVELFTPGSKKTSPKPGKDMEEVSVHPVLGMSSPADPASIPPEMAQPPPRPPPDG